MATATPQNGKIGDLDTRPKLARKGAASWIGTRFFKVDTDDVTEAMISAGLPAIGDPWDAARLPSCLCVEYGEPVMVAGKAASDNTRSGFCVVPVRYATPDVVLAPVEPGESGYTVFQNSVGSVTVFFGLETGALAINDGDGTSKRTGGSQALATLYYTEAQFLAKLPTWIEYATILPVNSDGFSLPPVRGFVTPYVIAYNENKLAQYLGFEMDVVGGLAKVTHKFELGLRNEYVWQQRKSDGTPLASVTSVLYEARPFAGLL
jgi:hypothetical protein